MAHARIRPIDPASHPGSVPGACMAVRAGAQIVLHAPGGFTPDGAATPTADAAAQARQALQTIATLLQDAGAALPDLRKLTLYVTDRAWLAPVMAAAATQLAPAAPAMATLVVAGLPAPHTLVAMDAEALAPGTGTTPIVLPGLTDPDAAATIRRHGHTPAAAAAQAAAVFARLHAALALTGGGPGDVCKITMHITDRAWRQAVYGAMGQGLPGVFPVSTGLIVPGLPDPCALVQLDAHAMPGGPHQRLRPYRASTMPYAGQTQGFEMDFCMAVRAGRRIFLRGQTGNRLDGTGVPPGDPAAQAALAIANARTLLAEAGADLAHATRLVTYVTDRAYLAPVLATVLPAFAAAPVASTAVVVKGLAAPDLLMEIDVHATLP